MLINPTFRQNRPRDWAFDIAKHIKARSEDPRRFVEGTGHTLPQLIAMRDARKHSKAIGLRVVRDIAKCARTREQKQRILNEVIETLGGAWLRGQQNHSTTTMTKPDACAGNGQRDRIAMQRRHKRGADIKAAKRMRGGLWPENRRLGGKPVVSKKRRNRRRTK